jgi:RNA recognition motif-containing protein
MDGGLHMDGLYDGEEEGFDAERTLYVANVVGEVSREQLKEFFTAVGTVTKVSIAHRHTDTSAELNYAFVEFKEVATAEKAKILSGTTLRGKPVLIQPSTAPGVPALPGRSAYQQFAALAGMGASTASSALPVPNVITAPSSSASLAAPPLSVNVPGSTPFYGNNMQTPEEVSRTIYVGNINEGVNAEQLLTFFTVCGPTNFCRMAGNSTHPARYAFIEFQTFDASQKAMQLNGMILVDRPLRVNKSKNPIVRPQMERRPDPRDRHARDKKLSLVVQSINRRVIGTSDRGGSSSHRDRSRSPSRRHSKRSRHDDDSHNDLPPSKRDKYY